MAVSKEYGFESRSMFCTEGSFGRVSRSLTHAQKEKKALSEDMLLVCVCVEGQRENKLQGVPQIWKHPKGTRPKGTGRELTFRENSSEIQVKF